MSARHTKVNSLPIKIAGQVEGATEAKSAATGASAADFQGATGVEGAKQLKNAIGVDGTAEVEEQFEGAGQVKVTGRVDGAGQLKRATGFQSAAHDESAADFQGAAGVEGAKQLKGAVGVDIAKVESAKRVEGAARVKDAVRVESAARVEGAVGIEGTALKGAAQVKRAPGVDIAKVESAKRVEGAVGIEGTAAQVKRAPGVKSAAALESAEHVPSRPQPKRKEGNEMARVVDKGKGREVEEARQGKARAVDKGKGREVEVETDDPNIERSQQPGPSKRRAKSPAPRQARAESEESDLTLEHIARHIPPPTKPERRPRRNAEGTGEFHDPPCDSCQKHGYSCEKERGGGACVVCAQRKGKCQYSGKKGASALKPPRKIPGTLKNRPRKTIVQKKKGKAWVDVSDKESDEEEKNPAPIRRQLLAPAPAPTPAPAPALEPAPTPAPTLAPSRSQITAAKNELRQWHDRVQVGKSMFMHSVG